MLTVVPTQGGGDAAKTADSNYFDNNQEAEPELFFALSCHHFGN